MWVGAKLSFSARDMSLFLWECHMHYICHSLGLLRGELKGNREHVSA